MRDPVVVLVVATVIVVAGVCQIIWRHRITAYLRGRRVPELGDAGRRIVVAQRASSQAIIGSVFIAIGLVVGGLAVRALTLS